MSYTPTTWRASETALSPDNLNHIEQGLKEAHDLLEPTALATALLDIFHPVGMYIETKDASFNPNTAWGGTWELETEGLVHVSGGTNYPVTANAQDGGEATHTLTTAEIPAHTHNSRSLTGWFSSRKRGNPAAQSFWAGGICSYSTSTSDGWANGAQNSAQGKLDQIQINATHTHDSVGGSKAHNNMQPYKNIYRWLRTA